MSDPSQTIEQWRRAICTADRQNLARAESKAHHEAIEDSIRAHIKIQGTYSWWLIWLAKQDARYGR